MADRQEDGTGPAARAIRVGAERAGARLDVFLAAELQLSRGQVKRLLEAGAVRLDGRGLGLGDKGMAVAAEATLEVAPYRSGRDERPRPGDERGAPPLLVEGSGWVAVDKPAGMPVHPLREDETDTVIGHLCRSHPGLPEVGEGGLRGGVVHRLDVDTSGVLLVATEQDTWSRLREAFAAHRVTKRYLAIVAGRLETPAEGLDMSLPLVIAQHRPARVRVATDDEEARGRSRTVRQRVRTVEPLPDATLVEVEPATGFLHQIRATLASLGHPLLGDRRYADALVGGAAPRHMLHAMHASFEEIAADAPFPADFAACLAGLRG